MLRTERKVIPSDGIVSPKIEEAVEYVFDSWSDYVSAVSSVVRHPKAGDAADKPHNPSWTPHAFAESMKLARDGWTEAESRIRPVAGRIMREGSLAERIAFQMACQGEEYDVGALLEGVPECMYLPTPEITQGRRIVRVNVPLGANCTVSESAFARRGAIALALADSIAATGRTPEMVGTLQVIGSGSQKIAVLAYIPLMSAGEDLDVPFLAFAVAHASTTRRLWFRLLEGDPRCEEIGSDSYHGGYGRYAPGLFSPMAGFDITIPPAETVEYWSDSQCSKWIEDELGKVKA